MMSRLPKKSSGFIESQTLCDTTIRWKLSEAVILCNQSNVFFLCTSSKPNETLKIVYITVMGKNPKVHLKYNIIKLFNFGVKSYLGMFL